MNVNIEPIPKQVSTIEMDIKSPISEDVSERKIRKKPRKIKHKKSIYEIDPKSKNLLEINREINRKNLRMDKKRGRSRNLYKNSITHAKLIKNLKEERERNLPKFSFQPKINKVPKKMKIDQPHLERTYNWLENKNKKIHDLKEKNEEEILKNESTLKLPIFESKKKKIFAISKVKLFIDHLNDVNLKKTQHLNLSMTQGQNLDVEEQKNKSRSNLKLLRKVFSKSNLSKSLTNFSGLERNERYVKNIKDLIEVDDNLNINTFKEEIKNTIRKK